MTPSEIKKIAEEYRKENNYHQDVADDVVELIEWLSERYYLVEKGKARKFYKKLEVDFCHVDEDNDWVVSEAMEEMENLFGPEIEKEEKE